MDAQEPHVKMDAAATEVFPGSSAQWRADIIDTLCIIATVVVLMFMFADQTGSLRTFAAFCFAFFVPGRAVVANWAPVAKWSDTGMSIVLSIAIVTCVSMVTLWLRYWHPIGLFQVEAALSLAGLVAAIARRNGLAPAVLRRRSRPEASVRPGPKPGRNRGQNDEDRKGQHVPPVTNLDRLLAYGQPERHGSGGDVPQEVRRQPNGRAAEDQRRGRPGQ
jgi:hypothetical protein